MRFASLIVELIRARPRLMFLIVVLFQALLWLLVPMLLYRAPPGDVATLLAFGREYQVGTDLGPPLAFWLGDIAFRAAGGHIFGVYVLAQVCFFITFNALYLLGRAIVGAPQAVVAVLLTLTITAFSSPGVEFGPLMLARPLYALVLLHSWQVIGLGRRNAWFALSIEAGLLLLTTPLAPWLLLLPLIFAVATARGRRQLASFDPFYALIVILVLALPYLVWAYRADALRMPPLPVIRDLPADLGAIAQAWGGQLAWLLPPITGVLLLTLLNTGKLVRDPGEVAVIERAPVDPLARRFVYFFAIVPPLLGSLIAAVYGFERVAGGAGIALLLFGLAVVVATGDVLVLRRHLLLRKVWAFAVVAPALVTCISVLIMPWFNSSERPTSLPAREIGAFFSESYERRTGLPLKAVAGDPQLAALIGMSAPRPHLLLDAAPHRTPWISAGRLNAGGGLVVWRAADTAGTPPEDIARRFPGLAPELPRSFQRLVNGREPLLRIGWAIIRPQAMH